MQCPCFLLLFGIETQICFKCKFFVLKPFCLIPVNIVSSNVRKCCKIVSLVKNVALWHLFVIFLMSTRESFVFVKTYFFPRCLTRLILDYKYLKIQRKGALHCLSSFVWSKGFLHLVCTMKIVWLGMSNHIMALSHSPGQFVCVCLCLFTNWAQTGK